MQTYLPLIVLGGLLIGGLGLVIYLFTWWLWHPGHILAVIYGKENRPYFVRVKPTRNVFKWRKISYVLNPDLLGKSGRFNTSWGIWREGVANQIDLTNLKFENVISAKEFADREVDRENRLVQRAINPFGGGYVSPMVQILLTVVIMVIGVGIIYATVAPKLDNIDKGLTATGTFFGVPYYVTPTVIATPTQ